MEAVVIEFNRHGTLEPIFWPKTSGLAFSQVTPQSVVVTEFAAEGTEPFRPLPQSGHSYCTHCRWIARMVGKCDHCGHGYFDTVYPSIRFQPLPTPRTEWYITFRSE